ncbi:hypothetical protein BDZ88DRAFT_425253 [Geranomyces variabilis]|nr:hypothetical protein BDZ88DRAFT_425253 [Geranomyces variabilis]KAJ3143685.1 hypothetical protein HDU90_000450 [Geranomyces variabilis]
MEETQESDSDTSSSPPSPFFPSAAFAAPHEHDVYPSPFQLGGSYQQDPPSEAAVDSQSSVTNSEDSETDDDPLQYGPPLPPRLKQLERKRRRRGSGSHVDSTVQRESSRTAGAGISELDENDSEDQPRCSVCLGPFTDRTSVRPCFHSFCLLCISQWAAISRQCPHCRQAFVMAVVHGTTGEGGWHRTIEFPDVKPPTTRTANLDHTANASAPPRGRARPPRTPRSPQAWGPRQRRRISTSPETSLVIERNRTRRRVYALGLRAKHVGSQANAKCREISPAVFAQTPALLRKLEPWIRRDLHALLGIEDVAVIAAVVAGLLRSEPDMRSDASVCCLAEYLGSRARAEHFIHELVCFAKSPLNMDAYDASVQYGESSRI